MAGEPIVDLKKSAEPAEKEPEKEEEKGLGNDACVRARRAMMREGTFPSTDWPQKT